MARDTSYYQLVEAIQTIVSQTTAAQVMSGIEIGEVIAVNPLQIRLDPKTVIPTECIVLTKATCLHSIDMDVDHITEDASGGSGDSAYAPHHHGYEGRKTYGYCDELEAVRQAIYKILNTERYQYLIYSWNYGIELADLFGQPIPYVYAEIQRRITEALLQDDRITDVYDFDFSNNSDDVLCKFSVKTRFGEITNLEKGVTGIV